MPIYQLKLLAKREVATRTIAFSFEKPENFAFTPGQYAGFTLINPSEKDAGGVTRRFSLASTPHEEHITIVTRIQESAYKRVLNTLALGQLIKLAGPTGDFILPEDTTTPVVLIAGGIGIAPFYSMIKQSIEQQEKRSITLFYGNQQKEDAAFLEELQNLSKEHDCFNLIAALAIPPQDWVGETGFINQAMIAKNIKDIHAPIYFICGSPVMVTTLQETLAEMGIDEERIKVEDFPGY